VLLKQLWQSVLEKFDAMNFKVSSFQVNIGAEVDLLNV
jgi:hypothetical protein